MTSDQPVEILRRRLRAQRLIGPAAETATDVVSLLTCVQSQEAAHASWSLGMRTVGLGLAEVAAEFDAGSFLRTHILRPTWHFVAAADVRWILELTAPRVHRLNGTMYRQLKLDQPTLDHGTQVILDAVSERRFRTRPEVAERLAAEGLPHAGFGLAYLIMNAELEGQICNGPVRGAQQTYAALDERVPASEPRPVEPAAELMRRFFAGHGPASLKDFTRWSSLTLTVAKAALASIRDELQSWDIDGTTLWSSDSADSDSAARADHRALLLPLYDEVLLSYPQLNFAVAADHPHPPSADLYIGSVIMDTTNVGTWRRKVQGPSVIVEVALAPGLSRPQRDSVERASQQLATFLGLDLRVA